MANHKLELAWDVLFEDGTIRELKIGQYWRYHGQEQKYIIQWLERMIIEEGITSKPIEIKEKYKVIECEPYQIVIGL